MAGKAAVGVATGYILLAANGFFAALAQVTFTAGNNRRNENRFTHYVFVTLTAGNNTAAYFVTERQR